MQAEIAFDPSSFAEPICRYLLARAEALKCTPSEALSRTLDEVAAAEGFREEKQPQVQEVAQ